MDVSGESSFKNKEKEAEKTEISGINKPGTLATVGELYKDWFLDYSSYVILERAVPALEDGLKPVQRRILHAMQETDDGRFNKVANIIGNTMQYHPHGDASISDAIINLGQKNLLIETQGNWGDVVTGDAAAAARYIEARLSKFAKEVVFNPETTVWQLSYDGRKKEPVHLPVKFPLLLALGADGIAVGLSTKILPHNFIELIKASIAYLRGREYELLPDFPTNGMADFTSYNQGRRGGRVRIRSKIEIVDKKTLAIRNVPFSVTTGQLIESIIKANENGKIKIKQVIDNTARDVEILVELQKGISPDVTIDALYAFTDCEISISPNACCIFQDKPRFMSVNEILEYSTNRTVDLLRQELEIKKFALLEKWHFLSLEKIFIEKRIYRKIEECTTWEAVLEAIDKGLQPYIRHLKREVTQDDIVRLTEIKIKRISKFDSFKADESLKDIENQLAETEYHLNHLIDYAVAYFEELLKKYGKGKERKTEIRTFDTIEAKNVAAPSKKLYVNREEGFFGFGLKKEEPVGECSDLDDIITFRRDGKYSVQKVDEKVFAGKDIMLIDVFRKDDERRTYNLVYLDGKTKNAMVKRFKVTSITRDKIYDVTKGNPGSRILYITDNPMGETEVITVYLTQGCKARKKIFDFDFASIEIKNKGSQGNILTRYPIRRIVQKSVDTSNVISIDVWYDEYVGKLNTKEIGRHLGKFTPEDLIISVTNDGYYEIKPFDLNIRFDIDKVIFVEKFIPERPLTIVYYHGEVKTWFAKRFIIETLRNNTPYRIVPEHRDSKIQFASYGDRTIIKINTVNKKSEQKSSETIELSESIELMKWKAIGKKLHKDQILSVKLVDIIFEENTENEEVVDENPVETEVAKQEEPDSGKSGRQMLGEQLSLF